MMDKEFASLMEDMSRELSTLKSDARTLDFDERESVDNDIAIAEAELAIAMGVQESVKTEARPVTIQEQIASLKKENEVLRRTVEEARRVETGITALRMKDQRLAYKLQLLLLKERILNLEFRILSHESESRAERDDPSEPTSSVSISLEDPSELTEYLGLEPEGPEDENPEDRSSCLARLPPQEEEVVRMRFGVGAVREHTYEEIATELGLPFVQVQEIEARALRLLRHPERSPRLRSFLENMAMSPTRQEQIAAAQTESRLLEEMSSLEEQIVAIRSDLAILRAEYPSPCPSLPDSPEPAAADEDIALEQKIVALQCEKSRLLDTASIELLLRLTAVAIGREAPPACLSALTASVKKHGKEKSAQQLAEQIRLDEEERRSPEYRRKVRRELTELDEEARGLDRQESEYGTGDRPEQDAPPEDLRKTWRGEDKGGVPSLDDLEEDESSELP